MGEDESLPRNRIALICKQCRLVNGQAPPGAKHLEDVGKWRCSGCGTMNGDETEVTKIVASIKEGAETQKNLDRDLALKEDVDDEDLRHEALDGEESDITQYSEETGDEASEISAKTPASGPSEDPQPVRRRAGRPKGSRNKRS